MKLDGDKLLDDIHSCLQSISIRKSELIQDENWTELTETDTARVIFEEIKFWLESGDYTIKD